MVVVSSGSTGSAFLLNPRATKGMGVLINGSINKGERAAFPDSVNREILSRYGKTLSKEGPDNKTFVNWTENILINYVIPVLKPTLF